MFYLHVICCQTYIIWRSFNLSKELQSIVWPELKGSNTKESCMCKRSESKSAEVKRWMASWINKNIPEKFWQSEDGLFAKKSWPTVPPNMDNDWWSFYTLVEVCHSLSEVELVYLWIFSELWSIYIMQNTLACVSPHLRVTSVFVLLFNMGRFLLQHPF